MSWETSSVAQWPSLTLWSICQFNILELIIMVVMCAGGRDCGGLSRSDTHVGGCSKEKSVSTTAFGNCCMDCCKSR